MKLKKYDYIIILTLIVITVVSILVPFLNTKKYDIEKVTIEINGEAYKTFPLDKDANIPIKIDGIYNLIQIKNKRVHVDDANCPDKLCVKDGWISKPGQILVCLPNKVVIQIKGEANPEIDSSTY